MGQALSSTSMASTAAMERRGRAVQHSALLGKIMYRIQHGWQLSLYAFRAASAFAQDTHNSGTA